MTEVGYQPAPASGSESMVGQAQEKVQETAQQVKGQASDKLREQVDTRSTQAGEQVASVADAMRRTGQTLREEGNDAPARVTDAVAERAERLGNYLTQTDGQRMLQDIEDFARRQPWVMAFGGLVFGIAASRFLKASSGQRYAERQRHIAALERGYEPSSERTVVFEPDQAPAYTGYGNGQ